MTLQEMMDELQRVLRYDGQLSDVDAADLPATLRRFLTWAVRETQRALRYPMRYHVVAVAAGQNPVDAEASDGIMVVVRAYWQEGSGGQKELLLKHSIEDLREGEFTTGSPSYYKPYGGLIHLFPTPSTAGSLIIYGVKKQAAFTSADDPNEVTAVPESVHRAAVLIAAARYLEPYTELFQKSVFYRQTADKIITEVRGDNMLYGMTELRPEKVEKWEVFP